MIVAHNLNALSTVRNLNNNNTALSTSLERLSSGYRINSGKDAPADLIISEALRAQESGLKRAVQNTQEAQNLLGITEGALHEVSSILKKMKQLAIHAANNGVTSSEQVAADQAMVDSSVMTIDRIARTTKYSDQFLLNGNKSLKYDSSVEIDSTMNFDLLNENKSEFYQIDSFKQKVVLSFSGKSENGGATMKDQASRAYFEIDSADNRLDLVTRSDGMSVLSKDQAFSLTGNKGSRYFSFAAGTTLGEVSDTIDSAGESIGVKSSLIFNSEQTIDMLPYTTTSTVTTNGVTTDGNAGDIPIFSAVQGITNMNDVVVNDADRVSTYKVRTTAVGSNQVTFSLLDGDDVSIASTTQTMPVGAGNGNGTFAVNLTSGNGTNVSFDYHYGYGSIDPSGYVDGNRFTTASPPSPIAGAVAENAAQNYDNSTVEIVSADANSIDTAITVRAVAGAGAHQVDFTLVGNNSGAVLGSQTVDLNTLGVSGTGSQAVTLTTANGSSFGFDYFYNNDTTLLNFERPTGDLFTANFGTANLDRPQGELFTFNRNGAITDNNVDTAGTYAVSVDSNTGAAAAVNSADNTGTSWLVTSNRVGNNVNFTLRDATGTVSGTYNHALSTVAPPADPDIGIVTDSITVATAAGTTVTFDYSYERDYAKGVFDTIPNSTIATFDRDGNFNPGSLDTTNTNGRIAANVTSPSPPVAAVQNIAAQIDIFDVVNGETPFTINAAAGASANEVVFTIQGNTTATLLQQTVQLNEFGTATTGFQNISLETPNGSLIEFDYYYENDPTTHEFDRPVGDLFEVDAVPVNSERLFNGLSQSAIDDGATVDINLDPTSGTYLQNLEYGKNTDGQGRLFIKVTEHNTATSQIKFELYKNRDYSASSLVGWGAGTANGTDAISIHESNDSGLEGEITFDDAGGTVDLLNRDNFGDDAYVSIGGIWGINGMDYDGGFELSSNARAGAFNIEETVFSGLSLGQNTDSLGQVYFKTVLDGANSGQVYAYRDQRMRDEDLVAISAESQSFTAGSELILNSANNSGLGIITRTGSIDWDGSSSAVYNGLARCEQLGVRITASDYGSDQFLQLQQEEGEIWEYYNSQNEGITVPSGRNAVRLEGADAKVSINGQQRQCNGLELDLATIGMSGHFSFSAGEVGATTVAQVGYDDGSVFTNAKFLTDSDDGWSDTGVFETFKGGANLVNAGNNTTQTFSGFNGGMQLQLGGGSHGQERTVLGLSTATALELGKVTYGDKTYSLNDLLGGQDAALMTDPVKAMAIIDQAVNDVSNLRARLGAWQANLLQTNSNNLQIQIENIIKTESYIRDADMATESTDFSKNQIMVQAGTSMLAQANANSRNVLSLLGA